MLTLISLCHLASADSLREICGGLASFMGKMVHLGIKRMPKRSTLSYANSHRPWQLFGKLCFIFAASTIGRIYKDRWQIELFFKAIKQNLKIKTFVGTSENAVKIQIWTALISILMLKILQMRSKIGWSLSNLSAMLRFNLLSYRELWRWLDEPYQSPALGPPDGQLLLFG